MNYLKLVLPVIFLVLSNNANSTIITNEDFSSPATGWSNNTRSYFGSNIILGGYNVLGSGDQLSKNYSLTSNHSQITIDFDFYRIDSWDSENFIVSVNNTILASDTYKHSSAGNINIGGSGWDDEIIHYSLLFNSSIDNLFLTFGTTLDQIAQDESWGIDNLVITETVSTVPVPAAAWLFGSALLGMFGFSRRKTNA